ncbi:MAG: ECF transporter S component [Candidatus Heimdallarchaeota archaeon]|nr:ECF transporter S component [Candidatus Heimdallarchaeota archaeon]MBY8993660.1 ECF transporter S component [Candidatus Heimdallarchaeota archaeon]
MKRYSTSDLIIIAIMAAIGLGTKQIVRPLVSLVSVPLGIPGGAIVGGFYMLWLVLTKRLAPKTGSGFLFGLTQALVVMILPFGSHGIFTLITYTLPGLAVDLVDLSFQSKNNTVLCSLIEGAVANFVGSLSVLILIFRLEWRLTLFISLIALLTGNIGGIIAHYIAKQISGLISAEKIQKIEDTEEELPIKDNSPTS